MPFDQLFAFATFAYVASATPGPNNILLTAVGGAGGIRGGLPVLFGIVFGFSAMVFLLAFGLGRTVFARDGVLTSEHPLDPILPSALASKKPATCKQT